MRNTYQIRSHTDRISLLNLFQFKKWKPSQNERVPKVNEAEPLSLFYYADEHLTISSKAYSKLENVPLNSERFIKATRTVHRAQRLLLDTLQLVYLNMDESVRADRSYREDLSREEKEELDGFCESILFAAEAISRGFRIRGLESVSDTLLESAVVLCASFQAVRYVFRSRALQRTSLPYHDLNQVVIDFDLAWTKFEKLICETYKYPQCKGTDLKTFASKLETSLFECLTKSFVCQNDIEEFSPRLLIILPRIVLLNILKEKDSKFLEESEEFKTLKYQVSFLKPSEMFCLEMLLGDTSDARPVNAQVQSIFKDICKFSNEFVNGSNAKTINMLFSVALKSNARNE